MTRPSNASEHQPVRDLRDVRLAAETHPLVEGKCRFRRIGVQIVEMERGVGYYRADKDPSCPDPPRGWGDIEVTNSSGARHWVVRVDVSTTYANQLAMLPSAQYALARSIEAVVTTLPVLDKPKQHPVTFSLARPQQQVEARYVGRYRRQLHGVTY